MDLLERYLQAVGQFLPAETRADTLAELRANLLEQMDAQAEELGRPLTEAEIADVLRAHGKPEVVALRYLPQRSLIGPTIFPFYLFTLRKALPLVVLIYAIAEGASMISTASRGDLAAELASAVFGVVPSLLIYVAVVTILFVIGERTIGKSGIPKKWMQWDPAKLPAVRAEATGVKQKSIAKRIIDLCVHCLWMAYVLMIPAHPFWLIGPGVYFVSSLGVSFAPIWHVFYRLLIVLLTVQLGMKLMALTPGVHKWMKPLELLSNLLGVVALSIMAWTADYFVPSGAGVDAQKLASVNYGVGLAIKIALFFAVLGLLIESWKYVKRQVPAGRLAF